jgi:hypothetical protein
MTVSDMADLMKQVGNQQHQPQIKNMSAMMEQMKSNPLLKNVADTIPLLKKMLAAATKKPEIQLSFTPKPKDPFRVYATQVNQALTGVFDVDQMEDYAHNLFIEQLYMQLLNGEIVALVQFTLPECSCNPNHEEARDTAISALKEAGFNVDTDGTVTEGFVKETGYELTDSGVKLFANVLYLDAMRQQNVHLLLLQLDLVVKETHLAEELELVQNMVTQQDALLQGLEDWSQYLDQQTQEYVDLYEKLDTLISTQRRKSAFTVSDVRSLEGWTSTMHVVFWVLVAAFLVMAVVHNYSTWNAAAEQVDSGLKRIQGAVTS